MMTTLVYRSFSRTTWVSWYQNVSILDFTGAKGDEGGSDNWSYKQTCKDLVKLLPPTNQPSTFYRPDALPVAQPTASEHWRQYLWAQLLTMYVRHIVTRLHVDTALSESWGTVDKTCTVISRAEPTQQTPHTVSTYAACVPPPQCYVTVGKDSIRNLACRKPSDLQRPLQNQNNLYAKKIILQVQRWWVAHLSFHCREPAAGNTTNDCAARPV